MEAIGNFLFSFSVNMMYVNNFLGEGDSTGLLFKERGFFFFSFHHSKFLARLVIQVFHVGAQTIVVNVVDMYTLDM